MDRSGQSPRSKPRKELNWWHSFNAWWRAEYDKLGRRPRMQEVDEWYHENAERIWGPEKPSLEATRDHAKCLRSKKELREYFQRYNAKKFGRPFTDMRQMRGGKAQRSGSQHSPEPDMSEPGIDGSGADGGGRDGSGSAGGPSARSTRTTTSPGASSLGGGYREGGMAAPVGAGSQGEVLPGPGLAIEGGGGALQLPGGYDALQALAYQLHFAGHRVRPGDLGPLLLAREEEEQAQGLEQQRQQQLQRQQQQRQQRASSDQPSRANSAHNVNAVACPGAPAGSGSGPGSNGPQSGPTSSSIPGAVIGAGQGQRQGPPLAFQRSSSVPRPPLSTSHGSQPITQSLSQSQLHQLSYSGGTALGSGGGDVADGDTAGGRDRPAGHLPTDPLHSGDQGSDRVTRGFLADLASSVLGARGSVASGGLAGRGSARTCLTDASGSCDNGVGYEPGPQPRGPEQTGNPVTGAAVAPVLPPSLLGIAQAHANGGTREWRQQPPPPPAQQQPASASAGHSGKTSARAGGVSSRDDASGGGGEGATTADTTEGEGIDDDEEYDYDVDDDEIDEAMDRGGAVTSTITAAAAGRGSGQAVVTKWAALHGLAADDDALGRSRNEQAGAGGDDAEDDDEAGRARRRLEGGPGAEGNGFEKVYAGLRLLGPDGGGSAQEHEPHAMDSPREPSLASLARRSLDSAALVASLGAAAAAAARQGSGYGSGGDDAGGINGIGGVTFTPLPPPTLRPFGSDGELPGTPSFGRPPKLLRVEQLFEGGRWGLGVQRHTEGGPLATAAVSILGGTGGHGCGAAAGQGVAKRLPPASLQAGPPVGLPPDPFRASASSASRKRSIEAGNSGGDGGGGVAAQSASEPSMGPPPDPFRASAACRKRPHDGSGAGGGGVGGGGGGGAAPRAAPAAQAAALSTRDSVTTLRGAPSLLMARDLQMRESAGTAHGSFLAGRDSVETRMMPPPPPQLLERSSCVRSASAAAAVAAAAPLPSMHATSHQDLTARPSVFSSGLDVMAEAALLMAAERAEAFQEPGPPGSGDAGGAGRGSGSGAGTDTGGPGSCTAERPGGGGGCADTVRSGGVPDRDARAVVAAAGRMEACASAPAVGGLAAAAAAAAAPPRQRQPASAPVDAPTIRGPGPPAPSAPPSGAAAAAAERHYIVFYPPQVHSAILTQRSLHGRVAEAPVQVITFQLTVPAAAVAALRGASGAAAGPARTDSGSGGGA